MNEYQYYLYKLSVINVITAEAISTLNGCLSFVSNDLHPTSAFKSLNNTNQSINQSTCLSSSNISLPFLFIQFDSCSNKKSQKHKNASCYVLPLSRCGCFLKYFAA